MERLENKIFNKIYSIISHIPRGKVATYGQIALLAGRPGYARQVGYALHALPPNSPVPWHRVVNSRGEISLPDIDGSADRQRALLKDEGIVFNSDGRIPLKLFQWQPDE